MKEAGSMELNSLLAARQRLKQSLEESESLTCALEETSTRLEKIKKSLPSLATELCNLETRRTTLTSVQAHIEHAVGPASAVLRVYHSVQELENSLKYDTCTNLSYYVSVVKQLEEALRFLNDNCGLAIQWMEDIVKLVDESAEENDQYIVKVKRILRVLKELKAMRVRAYLDKGALAIAFNKLEFEFRRLVKEHSVLPQLSSLLTLRVETMRQTVGFSIPDADVEKLHEILVRLEGNDRIDNCITIFVDVRSSYVRAILQAQNLKYLEIEVSESDPVQIIEDYVVQWGKHMGFAVKQLLHFEYELCTSVFQKFGAGVSTSCFAEIVVQSGFPTLLQFGSKVMETKKDAIKLLKLLDIFAVLDDLRLDFNRLFGTKPFAQLQTLTRDLIKKVVNGACEIFKELPHQVELQRNTNPPLDGNVPRLVNFVINYCVMLLEDDYRPILSQVLSIHQTWSQNHGGGCGSNNNNNNNADRLLRTEFYRIILALEINLEKWSKRFEDPYLSYFFLMNNYTYMHENLKGTRLSQVMGKQWLREHEQKMEHFTAAYLRETWGRLLIVLSEDDLILFSPGRSRAQELVKNRLREFNETFELLCKRHSDWALNDHCMRQKTCKLIVETVVPAYRSYLQNYAFLVEKGSSPSKYVKYSAVSLEALISCMFQPMIEQIECPRQTHLISRLRSVVTGQFRTTAIST